MTGRARGARRHLPTLGLTQLERQPQERPKARTELLASLGGGRTSSRHRAQRPSTERRRRREQPGKREQQPAKRVHPAERQRAADARAREHQAGLILVHARRNRRGESAQPCLVVRCLHIEEAEQPVGEHELLACRRLERRVARLPAVPLLPDQWSRAPRADVQLCLPLQCRCGLLSPCFRRLLALGLPVRARLPGSPRLGDRVARPATLDAIVHEFHPRRWHRRQGRRRPQHQAAYE